MSVNYTTGNFIASYCEFNTFREALAKEIGINDINQMAGFKPIGGVSWMTVNDDLVPFLNQPFLDRVIERGDLCRVAKRMLEVAPKLYEHGTRMAVETAYAMLEAWIENKEFRFMA